MIKIKTPQTPYQRKMSEKGAIFTTPRKHVSQTKLNNIKEGIFKTPSVQHNISKIRDEQILNNITTPSWQANAKNASSNTSNSTGFVDSEEQQKLPSQQETQQEKENKQSQVLEGIISKKDSFNLNIGLQLKRTLYNIVINLVLKFSQLIFKKSFNKVLGYLLIINKCLILLNFVLLIYYFFQSEKLKYYKMSLISTTTVAENKTKVNSATFNQKVNSTLKATTNTPYLFKNIQSTPLKSRNNDPSKKNSIQNMLSTSSNTGKSEKKTGYIPSSKYTFKMMNTPRKQSYI